MLKSREAQKDMTTECYAVSLACSYNKKECREKQMPLNKVWTWILNKYILNNTPYKVQSIIWESEYGTCEYSLYFLWNFLFYKNIKVLNLKQI